jgi:hypothetical protein
LLIHGERFVIVGVTDRLNDENSTVGEAANVIDGYLTGGISTVNDDVDTGDFGYYSPSVKLALIGILFAFAAHAEVTITIDRNTGTAATPAFHFSRVPPPAKDDAASASKVELIAGTIDRGSAGLAALTDGRLPGSEDEPEANLFFRGDSWGGRFRIDLGAVIDIGEVNSYSWHPDTRAPQVYRLYASDGTDPNFNPMPGVKIDLSTCGWHEVAFVDTRKQEGDAGGQYGVSIADKLEVPLGSYRYLLFDVYETESDDPWGNTFYSEIDVVKSLWMIDGQNKVKK